MTSHSERYQYEPNPYREREEKEIRRMYRKSYRHKVQQEIRKELDEWLNR